MRGYRTINWLRNSRRGPSPQPSPRKERGEGEKKRGGLRRAATLILFILCGYGLLAYIVLPELWTHYEHQRGLANLPMVTRTGQGIPGDPMNVGLIGDQRDVICAMHQAGWYPADPITLKSSIEIVGSVLLDRPYKDAPVSNLYYQGRREDLAYEKPIGASADRRNHVRYWKVLDQGEEKRPVWLGSATEDRGVGVLHRPGQRPPGPVGVLEGLDGRGAGHLAGPVAAHPVGHGPQATGVVDEDAVLVLRPAAADVGPGARGEPHCTISSTVWPIWSLSPRWSGIVLLRRSRLRKVPLVEPRSSTNGFPSRT